ncbi:hypothetical protein [Aquimarina sp. 2201CG5-10]|uniref:hypothetical protein n=1 Tax=Aquimarina callyspongiae TaxID=3098150 RepID=UPI002AB51D3D|nr:hypothetical protein [Aquimarina sp. 2201CG5-10]MDY8134486.1 hypothetical protein [Aquimarina sp. 2201CG5-10]
MKTIHNINKWCFIITLVLYVTIYLGLIAQFFLGAIQVILALSILISWEKLQLTHKRHLSIYFGIAILYGLLWATEIINTDFAIVFMTVVPMSIAGYFVYITNLVSELSASSSDNPSTKLSMTTK